MRAAIRETIEALSPSLPWEAAVQAQALSWVDSGAPLIRRVKPGTPSPHLVAYCVVVDGPWVLLVAHRSAGRWLPSGGHVDPQELPVHTAQRELKEELGLSLALVQQAPILLTWTETVGAGPSHTDVSLWFAFLGQRGQALAFDGAEFEQARWFHRDALPPNIDPYLPDFLTKLHSASSARA